MGGWEDGIGHQGKGASLCCTLMLRFFVQLLDHETRASDQVPLLLTMKEDNLALVKAVDSGDTDLGEWCPGSKTLKLRQLSSVPRITTSLQAPTFRIFFQVDRGWRRSACTCKQAPSSLRSGAKPRNVKRFLLQ